MYFENLASLIHMEGHGVYVWSTYGIGLLIIAYNIISPLRARKRIVAQIQRQVRSNQSRNRSHNRSRADRQQSAKKASGDNKNKVTSQQKNRLSIKDQGVREGEVE
ncbi:MAG: heme exporter protein CcmD [Endozoicomonas sp.]|uniref:heme exporter protein CcmD n=1 Tax=Endozoicomonas sp. TaxID=1892382 RepID=UPI003D9ADC72